MQIAMIGLGRMGANMARRLSRGGHHVVVYNRTYETAEELAAEESNVTAVRELADVKGALEAPRVVWVMLPAGNPTEEAVAELAGLLDAGDVIVEGGNSRYTDDVRRAESLQGTGVAYVDAGVSGGVWGLEVGYCTMVGGQPEAVARVAPALDTLAPAEGWLHVGPTGAGHFVKMVHNGIEYGMMQAYAEGFAIMEGSEYAEGFDYAKISHLWNQGSVIRSWLLELSERMFAEDARLDGLEAWVDDSGEGRWTIEQAIDTAVPAPVLTLALMERFRSRQENSFADRVLAAMRREFGGHAVKKVE